MSDIDLGDDDGYVVVSMAGADVRLDLYEVFGRLRDHQEECRGKGEEEYLSSLADLVCGLGFPAVSRRMAVRFKEEIVAAVEAVKKKDATWPEWRVSTASTPSA